MVKQCNTPIKTSSLLIDSAIDYATLGYSCSEAIMCAFAEIFDLPRHFAIKLSSGFGGGMGLMGDTCGAITAAFMIIGLRFGTDDLTQAYDRQHTYIKVADFAERFINIKGSLYCRELCVGHTMATPDGIEALRESGIPQEMIRTAASILQEMLWDEN